jgi:hypothetical protein
VANGPDAAREGELFDTTTPGSGNNGHLYGTTLAPELKTALVAYLKSQ